MGPQMLAVELRPVRMMYDRQMDRSLVFSLSANCLSNMLHASVRPWLIAGRACFHSHTQPPSCFRSMSYIYTYITPSPLFTLSRSIHLLTADTVNAAVMTNRCGHGDAHTFIIKHMAPLGHKYLWSSAAWFIFRHTQPTTIHYLHLDRLLQFIDFNSQGNIQLCWSNIWRENWRKSPLSLSNDDIAPQYWEGGW